MVLLFFFFFLFQQRYLLLFFQYESLGSLWMPQRLANSIQNITLLD